MLGALLNHRLDPLLYRIAKALRALINPNYLTFLGALANAAAAFFIAVGYWKIGAVGILVGGFFDLLDGAVARTQGRATPFGAFFDSVMDRISDFLVFIGLAFFYASRGEVWTLLLVLFATMGSVLVPFCRARAETVIPSCKVGVLERPERVILLTIGLLFGWMTPVLWILAVLTHVTVLQRVLYTRRFLRGEVQQQASPPPRQASRSTSQEGSSPPPSP
ncbi:MAG: CDP-alcohol phosphatidyltransferase family protein [Deltaproteobacteria bacterium]|nr:MAG: CDP-alcohol phosphatidyltransferase family protein [Deltaproteobacteria bacterium]